MAKNRKPKVERAEVHEELEGFDIKIDAFGQMDRNTSVEKLRAFLDERTDDKKVHREEE